MVYNLCYCNNLDASDLDEKFFMNLRLDEKLKCPDCLDTFDNKLSFTHHRSAVCGLDLKFECFKCQRRFKYNYNLKAHVVMCFKQKIITPEKVT